MRHKDSKSLFITRIGLQTKRLVFAMIPLYCAGPLGAQQLPFSSDPPPVAAPSFAAFSPGSHPDASSSRIDSHAVQLLAQMADNYAHLPTLSQRTVFYSATVPLHLSPDRRSYLPAASPNAPADPIGAAVSGIADPRLPRDLFLKAQQPNRLRLEMREADPDHPDAIRLSAWVSDGKIFWTYAQEKRVYTREKAPGRMSGFQKMGNLNTGSLELMMLMGVNPFAEMQKQVDRIVYEGTRSIRGVVTEMVTLESATPGNTTRASFYIGQEDRLLHRLRVETTPRLLPRQTAPGRVGDELDALMDNASAPPVTSLQDESARTNPMLTRLTYDNLIDASDRIDAADFAFKVPPGASLYAPFDLKHMIGAPIRMKPGKVIDGRHATKRHVIRS